MRLAAFLALLASPALAETDASALVAAQGLRGAEAVLAALPDPTPSESFALGGVRFLGGVERALQLRYAVGLSEGLAVMSGLPVLRLPLPENPAPQPFDPLMIDALLAGIASDMAEALDALAAIGGDDEVAVAIDMADLWFDIDADGRRSPGEGMLDVAGSVLGLPPGPVRVRFDTADSAWLAAYAHLLAGTSEGLLALGPSDAVARVTAARRAFAAFPPPDPDGMGAGAGDRVDLAAMAVLALEGQPDPVRTRALRRHLLAAVAENRRVWALVAREGDDLAEWIPNKRQTSATGLPFPPDTAQVWAGVLAEAEAVLDGRLLLPFWRVGPGAGLDLAALLDDPPELSLAGVVQGADLLPYLRQGPVADGSSLRLFAAWAEGRAALYAAVLN